MVPVMNDFEMDRNPALSADLSFLVIENAEKTTVSEGNISDKLFGVGNEDSAAERVGMERLRKMRSEEVGAGETRVSEGDFRDCSLRVKETRVSDFNSREAERKMEARVSETSSSEQPCGDKNGTFVEQTSISCGEMKREVVDERRVSDLSSSCSVFDEGSIVGSPELTAFDDDVDKNSSSSYGFEPGDMVWGKVKSHPWWPGHIFNEAFATSAVRRTKREGHVLVAFFGDSSYGWFDPSELIPFESHYAEKSRQTNSRNFMKAVEEAVDELSRRCALGLACRCRNPFNFRPTTIQGYFVVDVDGYEPGGVYSAKQIKSSRDSFDPVGVLSFLGLLALVPRENETMTIDQIKNVASILAYRRAVYEEFDETYAQAFGQQPVRPSRNATGALEQPDKVPSRAPLSGPLVIAEALGEKKNSKLVKAKDQSKKDKYLLKRRDEPNEQRIMNPESNHVGQVHVNVMPPSAFNRAAVNFPIQIGGYVLQKRAPASEENYPVPTKQEPSETMSREVGALIGEGTGDKGESVKSKSVTKNFSLAEAPQNVNHRDLTTETALDSQTSNAPLYDGFPAMGGISEDRKMQPKLMSKETAVLKDMAEKTKLAESGISVDTSTDVSNSIEPKLRISVPVAPDQDQAIGSGGSRTVSESVSMALSPGDVLLPSKAERACTDGVHMEANALKRSSEALNAGKIVIGEKAKKKKKKKRKDSGVEPDLERVQKRLKVMNDSYSSRILAGKSIGITPPNSEHQHSVFQSKGNSIQLSELDVGDIDLELPELVDNLLGVALDPFHGIERNSPAIVLQAFLKFRSLVYQKSLVLPPASEPDIPATKSTTSQQESGVGNSDVPSSRDGRERPGSKSVKTVSRPRDPAKIGRKRSPSDRQEEMLEKKKKKISELKALASEKKASGLKTLDGQKGERKETTTVASTKPIRPESVRKPEPPTPPRPEQPTLLVMKFPPRTTLPSAPQLKATFARFGPLDLSGIRVFWKSSSCRVVFRHKAHAQEAYSYARKYSPFGQGVNYHLRELDVPAPELPDTSKRRVEDSSTQLKFSNNDLTTEHRLIMHQHRQTAVQLKSCLKKPSNEEAGPSINVVKESPRVKFQLGGEESSKGGEPLMMVGSNNGSIADGASSSLALELNSKNVKSTTVLPPSQPPPVVPISSPRFPLDVHENRGVGHFGNAFHQHPHFSEVERRNDPHFSEVERRSNAEDIAHQMLSLLMRCNDIVTNVKSTFGYVPYHPL